MPFQARRSFNSQEEECENLRRRRQEHNSQVNENQPNNFAPHARNESNRSSYYFNPKTPLFNPWRRRMENRIFYEEGKKAHAKSLASIELCFWNKNSCFQFPRNNTLFEKKFAYVQRKRLGFDCDLEKELTDKKTLKSIVTPKQIN